VCIVYCVVVGVCVYVGDAGGVDVGIDGGAGVDNDGVDVDVGGVDVGDGFFVILC